MSGKHDRNSPSQLKKRAMCPGSAQLEMAIEKSTGKNLPDMATKDAIRGIVLHKCVFLVVEKGAALNVGDKVSTDGCEYTVNQTDIDHVMEMVNHIRAEMSLLDDGTYEKVWEHQVDLEHLGIKNSKDGSRVDLILIIENDNLKMFEFKFGRSWVDDPKYNWQIKAYSNGILKAFGGTGVEVHLLQPNAMSEEATVRQYTYTTQELEISETQIRQIIESTKDKSAPLAKGYHCEFCVVRQLGVCPMFRDAFLNIPQHLPVTDYVEQLDPHGIKEFYENLIDSMKWIKGAIKTTEDLILDGKIFAEGYEVGFGRNKRQWNKTDEELAAEFPSLVKETIMSPADAEKQHGKKFFKENFDQFVDTVNGPKKVVKSKA